LESFIITFICIVKIQYNVMSQSTLGRIWDRLIARYEQDTESECCGPAVRETASDASEDESENCCE